MGRVSELAQIYVYDSITQVHILSETDNLTGGTILPGLQLPLADIFGPVAAPTTDATE